MPSFNCMYCAGPASGAANAIVNCPRCGKAQAAPASPPFYFPFNENELQWIRSVQDYAQRVVQEPGLLVLDLATERALKDIVYGFSQRMQGLTGGADPRVQQVNEDANSVGLHGYAIGRAILGTLEVQRDLKSVYRYSSGPDFAAKLRAAAGKLRERGTLATMPGPARFCLHDAFTRWVYYEVETRGLQDWGAPIASEIEKMLQDAYLLAMVEEAYYKDGLKILKSQGMTPPMVTPQPGLAPRVQPPTLHTTPAPGPQAEVGPPEVEVLSAPTAEGMFAIQVEEAPDSQKTPLERMLAMTGERYIDCEYWAVEQSGKSTFTGYKFFDQAGLELPKERYLKYGAVQDRMGKSFFINRLNIVKFLQNYHQLLGKVVHVTDPTGGAQTVYSDTEAGAQPLDAFYAQVEKEISKS